MLLDPPVATLTPSLATSRLGALRDSIERIRAIARHNVTIRLRDPGQAITYVMLPMILMVVLKPLYERAVPGGTTAIVTGLIVMFSVFTVGIAGNSILAERQWRTWDRLRQSRANSVEIVIGKTLPIYTLMVVQQTILFAYGCAVIGMPVPSSLGMVALSILAWAFALLAMGAAIATVARSLSELGAITDIGAMVLSSMAGALVPLEILPGWAQAAAHASPGYYALEMFRGAIRGDGQTVLLNVGIVAGIGLVCFAFVIRRLARGWGRTTLL